MWCQQTCQELYGLTQKESFQVSIPYIFLSNSQEYSIGHAQGTRYSPSHCPRCQFSLGRWPQTDKGVFFSLKNLLIMTCWTPGPTTRDTVLIYQMKNLRHRDIVHDNKTSNWKLQHPTTSPFPPQVFVLSLQRLMTTVTLIHLKQWTFVSHNKGPDQK